MGRDSLDAVICGGGFAGMVTAAALARAGLRVAVLDALAGPIEALRGELIHPPGVRALGRLGLEGALREAGGIEVHGFAAYDGIGAKPVLLPYARGSGMGLEHRTIVAAIREKLARDENVVLHTRARVDGLITEDGRVVGVRAQGGLELRAGIVVGADGRHSKVRKLLELPCQSTLLSYTVGASLEGDVLPEPNRGHVVVGAVGPILAYPFGRSRVRMNIDVPLSAPKGRGELTAYVRENYARFVPDELRPHMLRALADGPFIACANHAVTTEACAVRGAALVGDAGGCSHPLTATGMTLALHDAETLADAIAELGVTDDALLAYQQRRYRYVRARETFAYALYEVFRAATPGARAIADGVFRYWRDPRARFASMAILSGDESGTAAFASEYARVVGHSGWNAFAGNVREAGLLAMAKPVRGVITTASECFGVALEKAITAVTAERARELGAPGETPAVDRLTRTASRLLRAPLRGRTAEHAGASEI